MRRHEILFTKRENQPGFRILALAFAMTMVILGSAAECQAVSLTITATNGSVTATPVQVDYNIGEVVELKPKPDTGYYFSGWSGDVRGKRLVLNLTMDSDKTITANFDTWQPPIGIPEPEFGIFETHTMYVGQNYDFGSGPEPYRDAGNGPYTHYIDNTHPNATDSGNPHGTASTPRNTIPRDIAAGSVVEVHGGPYAYANAGDKVIIAGLGSADKPIFVRGSDPENKSEFRTYYFALTGQYMIVENIYMFNAGMTARDINGGDVHHISIRNNEYNGDGTTGGGGGLSTGSDGLTDHIVFYNNHVYHHGDYAALTENDRSGVALGFNSHHVWIVDNHIHHNGGDSVIIGHSAPEDSLGNIYIGRNDMHDDGENALDFKNVADVVVSQNIMHNYSQPGNPSADGTITVSHYGGTAPGPQRVWFLYNEMYNAETANQIGGGARDNIYFIGNVIHDIQDEAFVTWSSRDVFFVGNTMYNVGVGIDSTGGVDYAAVIVNNVFGSLSNPSEAHITLSYSDYLNNAIVSNNLFQDPMNVNSSSDNSVEADPQFVDAANGDFRLQSTSPAIDAGISSGAVQQVFDRFQALYGIDIRKDIEDNSRPQGVAWDIGAYEYVQGPVLSASSTTGGSVTTPGEGSFQYDDTTDVSIEATADQYYYFVNWTGTAVDAGKVANPNAASTTVTVDSGYTIRANFDTDLHALTVSSSSGGSVSNPGEGSFLYGDQVVPITATAVANYHFVNWTGTAVDAGRVANANSASTTVTVNADYTLQANFSIDQHNLTTSSNGGGTVATPGVGTYAYNHGSSASVVASAASGYHFVNWTGTAVNAVKVGNASSASTTVTMDAAYSIQANFAIDQHTLTVSSTSGGSVSSPGEGPFQYDSGTDVSIQATAASNYYFVNWTGTAVNAEKVTNPNSASTTVTVDAGYTVQANFGQQDGVAPTISNLSPASGSIQAPLNSLIILHVTDVGIGVDAGSVEITLDGATIYSGDTSDYDSATGSCRRVGTPADYTYAYQSDAVFDFDQLKTVTVNASDIGGVVMSEQSYSFTTEMRSFGENKQVSLGLDNLSNSGAATVCDSSGNIWAVWHAGPAGSRDIYLGKLIAGSDAFSAGVRLTSNNSDQLNPAVARGTDDKLYVVWQDNRRGVWDIYGSTSANGTNWSAEQRIDDSEDNQSHNQVNPVVVVDSNSPNNNAYVAWQDDRAGNQDIFVGTSSDSFSTNSIAQVTSNTADQTGPAIAVTSSNVVHILWTDARNASTGSDIYGASGNVWTNVAVVRKAGNQSHPVIAAESSGSVVHMLWVDQISGNSDIYYASSSGLPGSPVAGSNLVDDALGTGQLSSAIAVTGTGSGLKVFACWQDGRNVSGSTGDLDLYMVQANSGSGTNVFVGDGGTNSDQTESAMGIDQDGYPYVVWTDNRSTNTRIYFAGSTCMQSTALVSGAIDASSGGTVGTADVQSITDVDDVSIAIPAGACPYDVTISVTRIDNPQEHALPILGGYEFGPSGMEFNSPVTITIPYAVSGAAGTPTAYWYNSLTGALSQQGISNIEIIELTASLHALRFTTTHLTPYYALLGAASDDGGGDSISSSGGGGGGGCSLSHHSQGESIVGYFLPYGVLTLLMLSLKRRDQRCKGN